MRVAPQGETGLVSGQGRSQPGPALLRLEVFDASAVLQRGEPVVTFGGWPYAPGVPVGVITRVVVNVTALTKIAYVRPFADEGALGVVGVIIVPPRHNPRFSVLPPRPRPSTSPAPARTASPAPTSSATPTAGA